MTNPLTKVGQSSSWPMISTCSLRSPTSSNDSRSAASRGPSSWGSIPPPGKLTCPPWARRSLLRSVKRTCTPSGRGKSGTSTAAILQSTLGGRRMRGSCRCSACRICGRDGALRVNACATPMPSACPGVICSASLSLRPALSAHHSNTPITDMVTAMRSGERSVSSALSPRSFPTMAPGIEATTRLQKSLRSEVSRNRRSPSDRNPAPMSRIQSRQNTKRTANSVPQWSATSKARPGSSHPSTQGTRMRWALEEMGKNSARPWTMPRMMAWWIGMREVQLRPFLPRCKVLLLLGRELVDPDAHRLELEPGDLAIDLRRHRIHLLLQLLAVLRHVLGGERLVGEAHVHHARRMPLGRGEVDEAALAQHRDAVAVLEGVLVDELAHRALLRVLLQPGDVDLDVEVAAVRDDRAVLHLLEMRLREDAGVAGHGAEEVADLRRLQAAHDAEPIHGGFQGLERIDLGDHHVGAHALRPHGQAAAAPSVAEDDEDASRQEAVGGAHHAVDGGLAGAIAVVEHVLGQGVVDADDRERERAALLHRPQADDAGGGLLGAADHLGEQIAPRGVQLADEIAAVVHRHLRAVVERRLEVAEVGLPILALDGEDADALLDQRGSDVVLGGERIRGAEGDVGGAV